MLRAFQTPLLDGFAIRTGLIAVLVVKTLQLCVAVIQERFVAIRAAAQVADFLIVDAHRWEPGRYLEG